MQKMGMGTEMENKRPISIKHKGHFGVSVHLSVLSTSKEGDTLFTPSGLIVAVTLVQGGITP